MLDNLYVRNRIEWRNWLENNLKKKKEIWLIFPRVATNIERVSYNDAVEEALCFGWIDSILRSYDSKSTIQRFTPRKPNSSYSQSNKERINWLFIHNMIHPLVVDSIKFIIEEKFEFPKDIIYELKKDVVVWKNYNNFSESYKRIRISYINDARKRPDEFIKRLNNFIEKTHQNKIIKGHGGIDKYY